MFRPAYMNQFEIAPRGCSSCGGGSSFGTNVAQPVIAAGQPVINSAPPPVQVVQSADIINSAPVPVPQPQQRTTI